MLTSKSHLLKKEITLENKLLLGKEVANHTVLKLDKIIQNLKTSGIIPKLAAILIGENEVNQNQYTVKNLFDGNQHLVSFDEMLNILKS